MLGEIWEAIWASAGRDCAVAALGGGVVGDLAGFALPSHAACRCAGAHRTAFNGGPPWAARRA
ncbi:MAG: hypothetical protein ACLSVD_15330 [Eggerthellaceae bacterium]